MRRESPAARLRMGWDSPALSFNSAETRDVLNLLLLHPFLSSHHRQSNTVSIQAGPRNGRGNSRKKKGVRNDSWLMRETFCRHNSSALHREAQQPDPNPAHLPKATEQRERNASDAGIAEGFEEEQIPAVLGAEAAGDEEGAAFDEDRERADGDGGKGHGRTAEIIEDDVHFQRFCQPAKKE